MRPEKKCRQCFAYIPARARKCKFCGYKFTSSTNSLVYLIKRFLHLNSTPIIRPTKLYTVPKNFFSPQEIEQILKMDKLKVLMFLTLDNLDYLDESVLIQLGETLSSIKSNQIR